ncbi:MAG: hypothetical protein MJ051_00830 [Akkermansia sp.]|nr:hypothetical protein [Akkermansia sp.]
MTFCKFFAAAVGSTTLASAFSLYDTAPMVGVPESQAPKYSFTLTGGYDTNPYGTTNKQQNDSSAYVNAGLSASYADVESAEQLSYNARIGGSHYLGTQNKGGRKYYGDCSLTASMTHAFSMASRYTGSLHVSYMPEPGYDNGFSSAGMQGDTLSWSLNNRYSEAIDARWSWNLGLNLSGTKYEEHVYSYDDRQYYSASFGINYRESDRLTHTASFSYRDELRSTGMNSQSVFGSLGSQYALSSIASASVSVGAQSKFMGGDSTMNPTLDLGYRRRVSDGLSMNAYVKYSDENVDNYNTSSRGSYRSCATWRAGAYGTYVLSPDVSFTFRMQAMQSQYRKPTNTKTKTATRYTLNPSVSMQYSFTPSVVGTLAARYTYYHYTRGGEVSLYARVQYSAGLTYNF